MVEEGYTRRDLVITLGFCFLPMIDRMRNIRGCEFEGCEIERGRKRSSRDLRLSEKNIPQGLKPRRFICFYGTTEQLAEKLSFAARA